MGKRKYDKEGEDQSKKAKKDINSETENASEEQPQNKDKQERNNVPRKHGFDVKLLRKELASKQGQTMALTQFLQVCLNPDNEVDYLLEYLKVGGNSHEILRQITSENKKNLTLATPTFHLFHLIILKVQSSLPHMIAITEEACRYFLNTFMSTVEIMISENSGPRHRKIILKLLTSMVTLNSDLGVEVLNQAPLTPKHLQHIVEKSNYKEKDNVRTSFVHFMTSFLVEGHLPLIKALLEKPGLLGLVIPGLLFDEAEAVLMFLNILKKNVIDNAFISKSLKLKTFSHQVLHNLFKIFSWRGPPETKYDQNNELRVEIVTLLSNMMFTLFTSHKLGLYFVDHSLGTTDTNKNQNLYKALLTLKRPWENEQESEVILSIIHKCPDLHRALINVVEQSFEPQHSRIWEKNIDFTIKLLDKLKPEDMVQRMSSLNAVQAANFIRFVCLPVPLLKYIQKTLGSEKDLTVCLYCVKVLVKMLQTLRRYIQLLEMGDSLEQVNELRNKLEYFLPKHLPSPAATILILENVIFAKNASESAKDYKLPSIGNTDALTQLLELLLLYNDIHPTFLETLEAGIDLKTILDFSTTLSEGNISLLKLKVVSLWLKMDSTAMSLKNPMFKSLFLIMLEVYMSDDDVTRIEAKDILHDFFKNTSIFESDENEIHLILYTLRNAKVDPPSLIGDIVEYILLNNDQLVDQVREQLTNIESCEETNEKSLNKLLDDLMENKHIDEGIFLENKMPSPFISGCIQYIHTNKESKKVMKHFLSLYVTNLFHGNFSPEVTEILIGDSKLDARNYVASWVSQPTVLPDSIVKEGQILNNISLSVLGDNNVNLTNIFPFLEEASADDSELTVDGMSFKTSSKIIDKSELFIWAKYLIFCTVRLSNMSQLSAERMKKIKVYFQCILTLAKLCHLVDMCRNILLNLLKNPHVLKVYKPVQQSKDEPSLPTAFLLEVITEYKDTIQYLNSKHLVLKSYQQKNYSEIVKVFNKINKKKNVNIDHTLKALDIVGLSKEDDKRVLDLIFGADINACLIDNKEPSIVLELLKSLSEKYSKSITLELPQQTVRKILILYTQLLTNTDLNPNLTSLEITLTEYFENRPHHVKFVSEELFKKFFNSHTVRKSTAQLAAVLIQFNLKLANAFKKELSRKEILSQRELTLPLGCAVTNHKQFILENKELLLSILDEYKTNINKMLEKPHKAGQIYMTSSQFIKKLIYECMTLQECQKLFAKSHKFEVVELSHVQSFHAAFLKICVSDKEIKIDYLVNYLMSMLNIANIALKEGKDVEVVREIIACIYDVVLVSKSLGAVDGKRKEDFKKITESGIWQGFCKAVLKDSLKVKTADQGATTGPQQLCLFTNLVRLLYPNDHDDINTLFDMVTSHSEFLNVMLSYYSTDTKARLIELLYTLILKNKSVMKTQQIPVYLSAYHATRSPCDRILLAIVHYYEASGLPVNEYKPYVWGDSGANYYAVRKNRSSSLWAQPTPNQVLNLFEKETIERTVIHFPVTQKLDYHYDLPSNIDGNDCSNVQDVLDNMLRDRVLKPVAIKDTESAVRHMLLVAKYRKGMEVVRGKETAWASHGDVAERVYDPVFVLPLLSHLLAPGSAASCFRLLRSGLLALPVMTLSSHCQRARAAAYHVLHRFCLLLDTETRHKNDKLFLTDFINTLKQSISSVKAENGTDSKDLKSPRIPVIDALYLARGLMVSTAPSDPLYKPINNFLIAKQHLDLTVVPDFLSLFHDSDVESAERRLWILDVIKDGLKHMSDVNVVFKSMCLKMIMDYYSCALSDRRTKERILAVLSSLSAIPRAGEIMVEGYGLLSWLHSAGKQIGKDDRVLLKGMFAVLKNLMYSLIVNAIAKTSPKNGVDFIEIKSSKNVESEVLDIVYDLLRHVERCDADDVVVYAKIYGLMSKGTVKTLTKKQMLNLINKTGVSLKDSESVHLLTRALLSEDAIILKSKSIRSKLDVVPKGGLLNELTLIVQAYLN